MDPTRFDSITRLFASRTDRRRAVALAAGAAAGISAGVGRSALAQEGTPTARVDDDFPVFLFVQTFTQGTWQPAGEAGTYMLTLSGVSAGTVAFSDRPERIVTLVPTQQFLNGLGFTPSNPPNAALVAMREGSDMTDQEVLVIELFSPAYDGAAGTLTYAARVLEDYGATGLEGLAPNQTDSQLPESFAGGTLLIDDCSDGDAVCYQILNGEEVIVGNIGNVGCCYDWGAGNCEPCNRDTSSEYYGQLCSEAYPDKCTAGGGSWDCYVDGVTCPIV